MPDGQIALLDFGMVSSLTEGQRTFFINLIWAIIRGNSRTILRSLLEIGSSPGDVDERKLLAEIERLHSFLGRLEKNQVRLKVDFQEAEGALSRLERTGNRLAFSMVLLSFSIVVTGLVVASSIRDISLFGGNLPILELGFLAAGGMSFWLVYSIIRSGRI